MDCTKREMTNCVQSKSILLVCERWRAGYVLSIINLLLKLKSEDSLALESELTKIKIGEESPQPRWADDVKKFATKYNNSNVDDFVKKLIDDKSEKIKQY